MIQEYRDVQIFPDMRTIFSPNKILRWVDSKTPFWISRAPFGIYRIQRTNADECGQTNKPHYRSASKWTYNDNTRLSTFKRTHRHVQQENFSHFFERIQLLWGSRRSLQIWGCPSAEVTQPITPYLRPIVAPLQKLLEADFLRSLSGSTSPRTKLAGWTQSLLQRYSMRTWQPR